MRGEERAQGGTRRVEERGARGTRRKEEGGADDGNAAGQWSGLLSAGRWPGPSAAVISRALQATSRSHGWRRPIRLNATTVMRG